MKKILILTMSCNHMYYRALLGAVKDTWAKQFIQGEYKDQIEWFAYTSCDKRHPNPCIDYKDRTIYVDCPDDILHTYLKTKLAYQMVVDSGIEFDIVVRTNTSVYVNINNLIKRINILKENEVLGERSPWGIYDFPVGHWEQREFRYVTDVVAGFFFVMNRNTFEECLTGDNDNMIDIPTTDDVIIGKILFEKHPDIEVNSPNDIFGQKPQYKEHGNIAFPKYKPYIPEDIDNERIDKRHTNKAVFNNDCINDFAVIQYRPLYGDLWERIEKGHEFEHIYELYEAENQ